MMVTLKSSFWNEFVLKIIGDVKQSVLGSCLKVNEQILLSNIEQDKKKMKIQAVNIGGL